MSGSSAGPWLPPLGFGPITTRHTQAYASLSGDRNPVHLDRQAAAAAGLAGPAVHGMLLVAILGEAAERWWPDMTIKRLSTKFLAPVLVGDSVEVKGRLVADIGSARVARLLLHSRPSMLAVIGEAHLVGCNR